MIAAFSFRRELRPRCASWPHVLVALVALGCLLPESSYGQWRPVRPPEPAGKLRRDGHSRQPRTQKLESPKAPMRSHSASQANGWSKPRDHRERQGLKEAHAGAGKPLSMKIHDFRYQAPGWEKVIHPVPGKPSVQVHYMRNRYTAEKRDFKFVDALSRARTASKMQR